MHPEAAGTIAGVALLSTVSILVAIGNVWGSWAVVLVLLSILLVGWIGVVIWQYKKLRNQAEACARKKDVLAEPRRVTFLGAILMTNLVMEGYGSE